MENEVISKICHVVGYFLSLGDKYIPIQGNCFLFDTLHLLIIQEKLILVCHFIASHKNFWQNWFQRNLYDLF